MAFSQTQPYSNITIKEEPIDEDVCSIQEVHSGNYNMFEVKEEPEETFTIEEYFEIPLEVKEEKLDDEISEIIQEQLKNSYVDEKKGHKTKNNEPLFNVAKKQKLLISSIKEEPAEISYVKQEPEEQFEITIPKMNNILYEHNYFKWSKFDGENYSEENVSNEIQQDEDGIEYEEVNLFDNEANNQEEIKRVPAKFIIYKPSTAKTSLKCPECPTLLEDSLRLNRHMRLHKAPQFQCRNCLKWFKRQSTLKNHFCDLKCPTCPDICTCEIDTTSQNCKICLKIDFRYFSDYKRHMVEYHNEVVICKICEVNKYTLFKHKQQGHSILKHFKCPQCPLVLQTTELLETHMQKHSNIFDCTICNRSFTRRFLLNEHQKLHENPMAYYCKKCDKSFRGKFCLTNHLKTIHNEKIVEEKKKVEVPYHQVDRVGWIRCQKCPLLFRSKDSLNKHSDQAHGLSVRKLNRNWDKQIESTKRFETVVSNVKS